MGPIEEFVHEHRDARAGTTLACAHHPGAPAWAVCARCGRGICPDCFAVTAREPLCTRCRYLPALSGATARRVVLHPAFLLLAAIIALSLVYGLYGRGERAEPAGAITEKQRTRRERRFLAKAMRLQLAVEALDQAEQTDLAQVKAAGAWRALRPVVESFQTRLRRLPDQGRETAEVRERLGRAYAAMGRFAVTARDPEAAAQWLARAQEAHAGREVAALAAFWQGRLHDDCLGHLDQAAACYREAAEASPASKDVLGEFIESQGRPLQERRIDAALRHLAGPADPAHALYRLARCHERLKHPQEARAARDRLAANHPHSPWTDRLREETPSAGAQQDPERPEPSASEAPSATDGMPLPVLPAREASGDQDQGDDAQETLRVVPLDE